MNRLNKSESAVFLFCRFSLFLKDPFFFRLFGAHINNIIERKFSDYTVNPV